MTNALTGTNLFSVQEWAKKTTPYEADDKINYAVWINRFNSRLDQEKALAQIELETTIRSMSPSQYADYRTTITEESDIHHAALLGILPGMKWEKIVHNRGCDGSGNHLRGCRN
jgi:hypothetical protein